MVVGHGHSPDLHSIPLPGSASAASVGSLSGWGTVFGPSIVDGSSVSGGEFSLFPVVGVGCFLGRSSVRASVFTALCVGVAGWSRAGVFPVRARWHEGSLSVLSCPGVFPVGGVPFASFELYVSPGSLISGGCSEWGSSVLGGLSPSPGFFSTGCPWGGLFSSPDPALLPLFLFHCVTGGSLVCFSSGSPLPEGSMGIFQGAVPSVLGLWRVWFAHIWLLSVVGPFHLPVRPSPWPFPALSAGPFRLLVRSSAFG